MLLPVSLLLLQLLIVLLVLSCGACVCPLSGCGSLVVLLQELLLNKDKEQHKRVDTR